MDVIKWTENLSVNNALIDYQHKELIRLLNRLIINRDAENQQILVGEILSDLLSYIKKHFTDEEKYLRKQKYPDIEKHIKIHQQFSYKIGEFCLEVIEGRNTVSDDMIVYLSNWLIEHIGIEDQAYKAHINT